MHLIDGRASGSTSIDSARQNLAATFVNAFVNAGFGQVIWEFHLGIACGDVAFVQFFFILFSG